MTRKKIFLLLFLFIFLTTFYFDLNKTSLMKTFKLKEIEIVGINNSDINLINLELEKFLNKNIFLLNKDKVASTIINLDFINKIRIKKIYPNKLKIQLEEHKIIAIVEEQNNNYILSLNGKIIKNFNEKFTYLPLVYGKNTQRHLPKFYKLLKKNNFKINDIEYFKFFETKRWDIYLKNGVLIKFPNDNEEIKKSIAKFMSINSDDKFNKFKIFDFRVKNQLILN